VSAPEAAGFDSVLVVGAAPPRFLPGAAGLQVLARLAAQPRRTGRRLGGLAAELARVATGSSDVAASPRDRRFADPAWTTNPILRRTVQAYLAASTTAEQLVGDAGLTGAAEHRVRLALSNAVAALAPSNTPIHPAALRAAVDEGGQNFVRGAHAFARDMRSAPRIPEMVDTSGFTVGVDVAATPGAVVLRTEVFELIQYTPRTEQVRQVPLVVVPPTINKYYSVDIAPGRSLVEHAVANGQQVFTLSWRNPDARHADWGMDVYAAAVLEALDAAEAITGSPSTVPFGLCSGGTVLAHVLGHLAATDRLDRIAAVTFGVTVLDSADAGTASAVVDERTAALALAASRRRGYLDGRELAETFAWLRPDDLVWNYVVNNYLLGKRPPAFDLLFWNADTVRMTAALHRDYVRCALENRLTRPGAATALGSPVDLSAVDVDAYVVGGLTDHITPWQSCYRTTALLGGHSRFVLSTSGHIAALANPPGNPKANFRVHPGNPADPAVFLRSAEVVAGSWWTDHLAWLGARCGPEKDAPAELGGAGLRPLHDAPGTYVFDA
jgi:polyhydroxyalkanoate synthase